MNIPHFTVFPPLQNIINPVKKNLFPYKILDQNLVQAEATEGISEDSFLKPTSDHFGKACLIPIGNHRWSSLLDILLSFR
jgi:hypothetical protein